MPISNTKNRMKLSDPKCKMGATATHVDRNICRNNCSHYDRKNRTCLLGYNWKPKQKNED